MKKKILFILLLGGLLFLLLIFVSAVQRTTFSNGLTQENLTFTGDQNITRNISIYKNVNVDDAYLNLSGYKISYSNTSEGYNLPGSASNDASVGTVSWSNVNNILVEDTSEASADLSDSLGGPGDPGELKICLVKSSGGISSWCYVETPFPNAPYSTRTIGNSSFLWGESWTSTDINSINFGEVVQGEFKGGQKTNYLKGTNHSFNVPSSTIDGIQVSCRVGAGYSSPVSRIRVTWCKITVYYTPDSDYINNSFISINNTQIWNHTGIFNSTYSPNKTKDFSSVLNSALNNGKCDCTGCSLSGNNCAINFTFHSDTAGILEYSAIDINYTPAPFVTLNSPLNNTASPSIKTFNCSATDEIQVSNITFYFWNSTGDLNLSTTINITGTSNLTTYNMTFNSTDTFTWGCSAFNNNSQSRWADNNFTLNVDINNPAIVLNKPLHSSFINTQNTQFNYTPSHSTQTVDTCELWGNWTGVWHKNKTDTTITEDIVNSFTQNLTDDNYLWNIWCNTTETGNSGYSNVNFTFMLDTILPVMNDMTITTTADQTQFTFLSNITDAHMGTCKYSIWTGSIAGTNISFTCNTNTLADAPGFGTYTLFIYSIDLAGNENNQNLSFTTSIYVASTTTGGGGGGIIEMIKEPAKALICESIKEPFSVALKEWLANMWNWTKFKAMWFAMWNYSNCLESASLVPL